MKEEIVKIILQLLTIGTLIGGSYLAQDRRITAVEVGLAEQMRGYQVVLETVTARLNRMEDKIDRLIERQK